MPIASSRLTLSPIQKATARRMADSKRNIPHFYVSSDFDMETVLTTLAELNNDKPPDGRVSVTAAVVKAVDLALDAHPRLNARWEGDEPRTVDDHTLGIAIALPDGLVAPALTSCNGRSLAEIADALRDLVAPTRAGHPRAGHLRPVEIIDAFHDQQPRHASCQQLRGNHQPTPGRDPGKWGKHNGGHG